MKYSDLKSKTADELDKIYVDLKKELYNIGILRSNGELKDTARIGKLKKQAARILTLKNSSDQEVVVKKKVAAKDSVSEKTAEKKATAPKKVEAKKEVKKETKEKK